MSLPLYQIDAFTDKPFAGNPAAVCLLDGPREDAWMLAVAREMNLSETAFLLQRDDGFNLRWFSPLMEIDLCGHATLASAHFLWESCLLASDAPAVFHTLSGLLTVERLENMLVMDFPAEPASPVEPPQELTEGFPGVRFTYVGKNRLDFIVEVENEETLRTLRPNLASLAAFQTRGVIVTAPTEDTGFDFVSRFFAPGAGMDEDPVTGSAHCCLGPFWGAKLGKTKLTGHQISARGGIVGMELQGKRVLLSGQAVTVFRGMLVA